jgi:hypothetical protein
VGALRAAYDIRAWASAVRGVSSYSERRMHFWETAIAMDKKVRPVGRDGSRIGCGTGGITTGGVAAVAGSRQRNGHGRSFAHDPG